MTDPQEQRLARLEQILATTVQRVYALEQVRTSVRGVAAMAMATPQSIAQTIAPGDRVELEAKLGTYWLSRIGIVSLITGAALLVVTYFAELGPALRVAAGYAMAGAVTGLGVAIARRHQTFGRVVLAGGLAIGYFVTYALHFVPAMRVIDSDALGVVLVACAIAGIVAVAHRTKSETVAGVALFLGLHTGVVTDTAELSLACTTLLAAGAGFFIAANRWVIVPISTVIAVYTTHAMLAAGVHASVVDPGVLVAFLALDFALFAGALLVRPDLAAETQSGIATLNWFGAVAIGGFALRDAGVDAVSAYLAGAALVHAALAGAARLRGAPAQVSTTLLALAFATAALALPLQLHDAALVIGWLALAMAAAGVARAARRPAFHGIALAIAAVATVTACEHVGDGARLACVLAWLMLERLFAPQRSPFDGVDPADPSAVAPAKLAPTSTSTGLAVAGVALALASFATQVLPEQATIAGVLVAFLLFVLGFSLRVPAYRWAGFAALAVTASRFALAELPGASAGERIATFAIAGVVLLAVSFVYTRRKS